MNAMGQLLGGLQPLAQLGPEGFNAAKAILLGVCKRFKFGLEIADSLGNIQAPPAPQQGEKGPSPEEQAAVQAEHKAKLQATQLKMQETEAAHALKMKQIQLDEIKLEAEMEKTKLQVQTARVKAAAAAAMPTKGNQNAHV